MKSGTVVQGLKSKVEFVLGENPMTLSPIPPIFTLVMHFQWEGSNTTVRTPDDL